MCRYFGISIIDFTWKDKSLPDYIYLFSTNEYEKNDKLIPNNFR